MLMPPPRRFSAPPRRHDFFDAITPPLSATPVLRCRRPLPPKPADDAAADYLLLSMPLFSCRHDYYAASANAFAAYAMRLMQIQPAAATMPPLFSPQAAAAEADMLRCRHAYFHAQIIFAADGCAFHFRRCGFRQRHLLLSCRAPPPCQPAIFRHFR